MYKICSSADELINQFNDDTPKDSVEYQFYVLLIDYLASLTEMNDIHNVLKFITGGIQIPVIPKIKVSIKTFIIYI